MKILIADDHPLVRDALSRTLRLLEPQAEVIECGDLGQAEAALDGQAPEMALLDLHMPGMRGLDSVRQLRVRHPGVKLVVASGDDQPAVIRGAIAAGAVGFLPKSERPEVLRQAIRLMLDGGTYLPSRALEDVAEAPPLARPDTEGLTPRQLDVLHCLMRGEPNKVIARELGLTEGTVKIHIASILRTLQARNRTEAVIVARQLGVDA
jgi:DNA-binding NarL/FixJ family response regulator